MSVDAFLERRIDLIDVGKAIMAFILSRCDRIATLFKKDNNWYDYLLNEITTPTLDRLPENRLSIITYNYDRSLETHLTKALPLNYKTTEEEVWKYLRQIPIIHLHGKLGNTVFEGGDVKRYGDEMTVDELKVAQKGIRIIHEIKDNEEAFAKAHDALRKADVIGFLGFGYNQTNLVRLKLRDCKASASIKGTGHGLTGAEVYGFTGSTLET